MDDNGFGVGDSGRMSAPLPNEERARIAFQRLMELLEDMGWSEEYAIDEFYESIAKPLDQGKKSIKQWFERQAVPLASAFNVAECLGVDIAWLGGTPGVPKRTRPGLYEREVKREERRKSA